MRKFLLGLAASCLVMLTVNTANADHGSRGHSSHGHHHHGHSHHGHSRHYGYGGGYGGYIHVQRPIGGCYNQGVYGYPSYRSSYGYRSYGYPSYGSGCNNYGYGGGFQSGIGLYIGF